MDGNMVLDKIKAALKPGDKFINPGGGITTIKSITSSKIYYIRGSSTMSLDINIIKEVYDHFKGSTFTTNDLKKCCPKSFDPKASGHSCNCTVLFMLLKKIGLVDNIMGEGKRNSTFYIYIGQ